MAEVSPLRRRMIEDMTVRNLSPATQQSYIYGVAKFSRHFNRSPDQLGMEDIRAYQLHLVGQKYSWTHICRFEDHARRWSAGHTHPQPGRDRSEWVVAINQLQSVVAISRYAQAVSWPVSCELRVGRHQAATGAGLLLYSLPTSVRTRRLAFQFASAEEPQS
jgi:Phage integrase, N-terminal SAM-like domain